MEGLMKLWYAIRRPIGYVLFALLSYLILAVLHGLPYLLTDLLLGL